MKPLASSRPQAQCRSPMGRPRRTPECDGAEQRKGNHVLGDRAPATGQAGVEQHPLRHPIEAPRAGGESHDGADEQEAGVTHDQVHSGPGWPTLGEEGFGHKIDF